MLGHLGDDLAPAGGAQAAQVGVARSAVAGGPARIVDPHRVGEVVQGDGRMDAHGAQRDELVAVVRDGGVVDVVPGRLDARPLDREPVGVDAELADEGEVVGDLGVAADGVADEGAATQAHRGRRGPQVPVGGRVHVLDLGRCGRRAEPEAAAPGVAAERPERPEGDRGRAVVAAADEHGRAEGERGLHPRILPEKRVA